MPNSTVPAAAEGLPKNKNTAAPASATPPDAVDMRASSTNHVMTRDELQKLTATELHDVYEVICLVIDTMQGLICQPLFNTDAATLTPAGEQIDVLIEHLFTCRGLITDVAEAGEPSSPEDAEKRAWILLHRRVADQDHLQDIAALAAQLAAQQSHVEFRAKRRRAAA